MVLETLRALDILSWRHKIKVKERTWICMGDNCRAEEQDVSPTSQEMQAHRFYRQD